MAAEEIRRHPVRNYVVGEKLLRSPTTAQPGSAASERLQPFLATLVVCLTAGAVVD